MFRPDPRPHRRLLLLYGATIALPTCVLVWLGIQSFRRQDDAIARLNAEKQQAEIDRRVQAAAGAAFEDPSHPIVRHVFVMVDGVLVEPVLDSPPRRPSPPELAKAEHEELVLGRPDRALASYRPLTSAGPLGTIVRARIARCLAKLGRREEARQAWREIAVSAPDELDLAHRPYGIVAAIEAGETAGLFELIESGRWQLPGDQAEYFLSTLDAGRPSAYLDRFVFAREIREHFAPAAALAAGEIRLHELGERRIFYRAEGRRVTGFAADLDWIAGPLRTEVERDLRLATTGLDERWVYGGAVALVLLVLSSGVVLIWRDISREAKTSRLRAEFVSGVTHELKTPITLVRLYGETLLRHGSLSDEERRDAYRVIARESTRLGRLVDQVLSFARVERGQQTYELEEGGGTIARGMATSHPGRLTREHVIWAYRLLLDREPESEDVIGPKLAGSANTAELRHHLITSAEFRQKNPDFAQTNERTIVIKEIADGVRLFIDLSDHIIGLNILRGRYEEDEIALVRTLLQPGDTAIDAGSHVGFFTVAMAALVGAVGRVYAFEPLDSNAELLERSIAENRFGDRVVFQRAAVGAVPGTAVLTFPAETLNSGGAYLLRGGTAPLAGNQTRPVPLVALDTVPLRRPVRLIKMDVEGAEPLVLQGADRLLREDRPAMLSEVHPTQITRVSGVTAAQFFAQIGALGYRAHTIERGAVGPPLDRAPADAIVSVALLPD